VAHLRRSGFRTRSVRRATTWFGGPEGPSGSISSTSSNLFPIGITALDPGVTAIRFHGSLLLGLVTAVASGGFDWAFGIAIVSENAAGVGITAIPTPIADEDWDGWMVHRTGSLIAISSAVPSEWVSVNVSERVELDSKAMRKFKQTDVMVAVLDVEESGTAAMRAFLRSRILVKIA